MFLNFMQSPLAVAEVLDQTYIALASHPHFITLHPAAQRIDYFRNVRTRFVATAGDL
ncbi:MAG: hypothetical protein RLY14_1796 [Planctomycetota bacterium]|jgi:hypothetical protein